MKFRYTGFKDCDGRKIFTNDIVAINGSIYRISGTSKRYHLTNEWDRSDELTIECANEGRVVDVKQE